MNKKTIQIRAEELYALVWSTSAVALAKHFEISSSALGRKLRSLGIKPPPVGYPERRRRGYSSGNFPRLTKSDLNRVHSIEVPLMFDLEGLKKDPAYLGTVEELRSAPELQDITRNALYNLLGSVPLNDLADIFGRSPKEIRQICGRHDIPFPTARDWTSANSGLPVSRIPLPDGRDAVVVRVAASVDLASLLSRPPLAEYRPSFPKANLGPDASDLVKEWREKAVLRRQFASPEGVIEGLRILGLLNSDRFDILQRVEGFPPPPATSLRRQIAAGGAKDADVACIVGSLMAMRDYFADPTKHGRAEGKRPRRPRTPKPVQSTPVLETNSNTFIDGNDSLPPASRSLLYATVAHSVTTGDVAPPEGYRPASESQDGQITLNPRLSAFAHWLDKSSVVRGWQYLRDLAVIRLMGNSRLTLAQILSIRRDDVDMLRARARYVGEGGTVKTATLDEQTIQDLGRYGRHMPPTHSEMLFLADGGEPLTENVSRQLFAKLFAEAGMSPFFIP